MTFPSPQQQLALDEIASGRNVLITGLAGTGKSTLLNHLRSQRDIVVTASTGVAAINVGGITIHRWAGLGVGKKSAEKCAMDLVVRKRVNELRFAHLLAIDEISMLSAPMVDLLSKVLQLCRVNNKPFGGVQVVLFGDFCQLPPVEGKFAFRSEEWSKAQIGTVLLDKVFRQRDEEFLSVLRKVRVGTVDEQVIAFLEQQKSVECQQEPVFVFTHNFDVDQRNAEELDKVPGESQLYCASYKGIFYDVEALRKGTLAPDNLELKCDARVMLLKNRDDGLANGSTGTVYSMGPGKLITVAFDNGSTIDVGTHEWEGFNSRGKVVATKTQLPLRLAYAATAHKVQGMQFDNMVVDLRRCFAPGQSYVALSRAKAPEGLKVIAYHRRKINAHPDAIQFYSDTMIEEIGNATF